MNTHTCIVLLTFDFDAELLWAGNYPDTPAYRARGHYGARVGVPRLSEAAIHYRQQWQGSNGS